MEIKKNLTTQNWNAGTLSRIKYIVVHYTGNNGDTALANSNYFKSYRGSSAHYFVDENSIYQSVEDKNIAWHCGANAYYHAECRNHNSLGVELCSYINSKGNYAFKTKTIENAVGLIKELMAKYNIPIANVIRHYDVTKKICPEPYVRDTKAWSAFKAKLTTAIEEDDEMIETIKIIVNGKEIKADAIVKDGNTFIKLRGLEDAGFNVGFDENTKMRTLDNAVKELPVVIDGKETSIVAVNLNGFNHVPIRSMAAALDMNVDNKAGKVILSK